MRGMEVKTLDGILDKGEITREGAFLNVDKDLLSRFFAALANNFPHVKAAATNVSNRCSLGFHGGARPHSRSWRAATEARDLPSDLPVETSLCECFE